MLDAVLSSHTMSRSMMRTRKPVLIHGKKESKRPTARVIFDVPEPIRIIKSDGKQVKLITDYNQEQNKIE